MSLPAPACRAGPWRRAPWLSALASRRASSPSPGDFLRQCAHADAVSFQLGNLLGVVLLVHRAGLGLIFFGDLQDDVLHFLRQLGPTRRIDGEAVPGDRAEADLGVKLADFIELEVGPALSLIHISEPTRLGMISYAVF